MYKLGIKGYCMLILQLVLVLMFWITVASTEAWKWRQNDKTPDTSPVITWNSYHIWRSFTTMSVLLLPLVYVDLKSLLIAHCIGWLSYERWMSLVEYDTLLYKRPDFHLVNNIWIKRPAPIVEVVVIAVAIISYIIVSLV